MPGYEVVHWYGPLAPAKTQWPGIREKLAAIV
jgi:hypothetical protein